MLLRVFTFVAHRINAKQNKKKGQGHVQQNRILDTFNDESMCLT